MSANQLFTAADTDWQPDPAPWLSSRRVLALIVEVLPTVEDDLTADLLEYVALVLSDRDDEVRAIRTVLSSALVLSHAHHVEVIRLRQWDELSFAEIGARVGQSEDGTRMRYHRALPRLAEKVADLRDGPQKSGVQSPTCRYPAQ